MTEQALNKDVSVRMQNLNFFVSCAMVFFKSCPAALIFFLISTVCQAQFNTIETKNLRLVTYDFGHRYLIPHTVKSFENALAFHRRLFDYKPSQKINVLVQDFGDFGNGGATAVPVNSITMGVSPFSYTFETSPAAERIFSLMNHEGDDLLIKCSDSANAIYCHSNYGPCFGNDDLKISDMSNKNMKSESSLGYTYGESMFEYGSEEARTFLAGDQFFKTVEIEVYAKEYPPLSQVNFLL
jgi:hypothetical protein